MLRKTNNVFIAAGAIELAESVDGYAMGAVDGYPIDWREVSPHFSLSYCNVVCQRQSLRSALPNDGVSLLLTFLKLS